MGSQPFHGRFMAVSWLRTSPAGFKCRGRVRSPWWKATGRPIVAAALAATRVSLQLQQGLSTGIAAVSHDSPGEASRWGHLHFQRHLRRREGLRRLGAHRLNRRGGGGLDCRRRRRRADKPGGQHFDLVRHAARQEGPAHCAARCVRPPGLYGHTIRG